MVTFDYKKTPITQIADYIIMYSAKSGASDIHFDPRDNGLMVRIRIDGDLRDYTLIPPEYERNLTTRLKLLSNMNITESRLPQDGSIKGTFGQLYLDMRVSCLPTNEGEKIVIRILDYTRSLQGLEHLGFSHQNFIKLKRMIEVPNGIILVTGATGTGKSTTTYSILQALNKPEVNIITVEDPVEMNIEGLNQVQVNSEIGLDFAAILRSILRQDPNVILIGEIRDSETAKIAVRASITGHLVLSTIHTNNSLSTIERLLDMDVERYLLSSALTGIISQRLAKMLCPKCRIKREATKYEKKVFKKVLGQDITHLYDAKSDGCSECHNGYKGRIAVQEVLEIDDDIRSALNNENLTKDEMRYMVYTSNVITLLQDGLYKVLDGTTSFEEIYRIIEIDSDENDNYSAELAQINSEQQKKKEEEVNVENKEPAPINNSNNVVENKPKNESITNNLNTNITNSVQSIVPVHNNNQIQTVVNTTEELKTKESFEQKKEESIKEENQVPTIDKPNSTPVVTTNTTSVLDNVIKNQTSQQNTNKVQTTKPTIQKIEIPKPTVITPPTVPVFIEKQEKKENNIKMVSNPNFTKQSSNSNIIENPNLKNNLSTKTNENDITPTNNLGNSEALKPIVPIINKQ